MFKVVDRIIPFVFIAENMHYFPRLMLKLFDVIEAFLKACAL